MLISLFIAVARKRHLRLRADLAAVRIIRYDGNGRIVRYLRRAFVEHGVFRDLRPQPFRHFHGLQSIVAGERMVSDRLDFRRDPDGRERRAIVECTAPDRRKALWQRDRPQLATTVEGVVANRLEPFGKRHADHALAIGERLLPDCHDPGRNSDRRQFMALAERPVADGRHRIAAERRRNDNRARSPFRDRRIERLDVSVFLVVPLLERPAIHRRRAIGHGVAPCQPIHCFMLDFITPAQDARNREHSRNH